MNILNTVVAEKIDELGKDIEFLSNERETLFETLKERPEIDVWYEYADIRISAIKHLITKTNKKISAIEDFKGGKDYDEVSYILSNNDFFIRGAKNKVPAYEFDYRYCIAPAIIEAVVSLRTECIDSKNAKRDNEIAESQLEAIKRKSNSFFRWIPQKTPKKILELFLWRLFDGDIDLHSDGVKYLVDVIFKRRRMPKNVEAFIEAYYILLMGEDNRDFIASIMKK